MFKIVMEYSFTDATDERVGFSTAEEAYEKMCEIAGGEAFVQNEEFDENCDCDVHFSAFNKTIEMHYLSDDEWCHYKVVEE